MDQAIAYASPGVFTGLGSLSDRVLDGLDDDPAQLCWPVHELVLQPSDAAAHGLPAERLPEKQIRPAALLVQRLLALNPAPLNVARRPEERVIGTCRHFAVLACSLLRARRIKARVRCGFATYFQPGLAVDHWVIEYVGPAGGWVRLDPEILGRSIRGCRDPRQRREGSGGAEQGGDAALGRVGSDDGGLRAPHRPGVRRTAR